MNQPLNTPASVMVTQAETNLRRRLPLFLERGSHHAKLCIVGGGPSLKETLPILQRKKRDSIVLSLNNTHDWLIDRGIVPHLHVMLDAREQNAEFVRKPRKCVTYLIAAQCHPSVFEALEDQEVIVWVADVPGMQTLADRTDKPLGLIGGGSTVGLKAMMLAFLWGFRRISLFGMDGCYRGGEHHAYAQTLNDGEKLFPVAYGGKRFSCSSWMLAQAEDFKGDAQNLIDRGVNLTAYGEGLIPTILNTLRGQTRSQFVFDANRRQHAA